jgi:toxin ParE1/3/4
MRKVLIAPLAREDLRSTVAFIARDKPQAARRWLARIRAEFRLLARNPGMGEPSPDFSRGDCRRFVFGSYLIFFRPVDRGIEVIRVLHGGRDIRLL